MGYTFSEENKVSHCWEGPHSSFFWDLMEKKFVEGTADPNYADLTLNASKEHTLHLSREALWQLHLFLEHLYNGKDSVLDGPPED